MQKVITKRVIDRLDSFIGQKTQDFPLETEDTINSTKKTLKKSDGLIERVVNKIYITEDNRQLLND
jgi:hypothetical protein